MHMRVERKKYLVDNFIEIYDNAVPKDICEYFIDFFEKEYKLGNTYKGRMGRGNYKPSWKDCEDLNLIDRSANWKSSDILNRSPKPLGGSGDAYSTEKHLSMVDSYEDYVDKKFKEYFLKYPTSINVDKNDPYEVSLYSCKELNQGPLMHRYEPPEQGYHTWHCDWAASSNRTSVRLAVAMLYLNDVTIGGETEFYHQQLSLQPRQGTIVVWPAYFTHLHKGNPPISNTKYIVNKWAVINNNPLQEEKENSWKI